LWIGRLVPILLLAFGCFFVSQYSGQFKKLSQRQIQQHEYVTEMSKKNRKVMMDEEEDKELEI